MEKIIELDWCDEDKMFALIAHELGHIWHASAGGVFEQQSTAREQALFQLYSEGVAMLCEQKLCHNDQYYHQNKNGWLDWCNAHLSELKREYGRRVEAGESIQDFFGDWCQYQGHSDVGYYLGCQFVKWLLHKYDLLSMARLDNRTLEKEFFQFV